MVTRRCALIAGGVAAMTGTAGASPDPAPVHQVALEISHYPLAFVGIRVNQRPVRALIDTGSASALRLSTRLVEQLGLVLVADATRRVRGLDNRPLPVQQAHLDSLGLGNWSETSVVADVVAGRIESISDQVGTVFDGILGWRFLARWNVSLHYQQGLLAFSTGPLPAASNAARLPYTEIGAVPVVSGRIDDRQIPMLLDTGAPSCNIDTSLVPGAAAGALVERDLWLGDNRFALLWRVKDLSAIRAALGTPAVIGNNLLGRQGLHFDNARHILLLG